MTLADLVARAYPAPEWALFFEVANSTGARVSRYADAVALGIWPSRGYTAIGFEFKTDRRDWLRERANPAKADKIVALVDRFYLVTTMGVAATAEVPDLWGHLEANEAGTKLLRRREATALPDRNQDVLARGFVASMLRKVPETTVPKATVEQAIADRVKEALARSREGHAERYLQERISTLEQTLKTFKERTGVDLARGWPGPDKIGDAVKAVMDFRQTGEWVTRELDGLVHRLQTLAESAATISAAAAANARSCSEQIQKPEAGGSDGEDRGGVERPAPVPGPTGRA